jgi:hypothetical protein
LSVGRRGTAALVALGLVVIGACGSASKAAVPRGPQLYEGSFTVLSEPGKPANLCHVIETSLPPQCDGLPVVGWNWDAVSDEESRNGTNWGAWHVVGTYNGKHFTLVGTPTSRQRADPPETKRDFSPACDDPDVVDASEDFREWEAMTQVDEFEIQHLVAAWVSDPRGEWDGPFVGSIVVLPGAKAAAVALVRRHYAGALCVVERDGPTEARLEEVQHQLNDREARAAIGTVQSASSDARKGVVNADVWVADRDALTYARDRWAKLVELHGLLQPVRATR